MIRRTMRLSIQQIDIGKCVKAVLIGMHATIDKNVSIRGVDRQTECANISGTGD